MPGAGIIQPPMLPLTRRVANNINKKRLPKRFSFIHYLLVLPVVGHLLYLPVLVVPQLVVCCSVTASFEEPDILSAPII
jgi:hypothetical protein